MNYIGDEPGHIAERAAAHKTAMNFPLRRIEDLGGGNVLPQSSAEEKANSEVPSWLLWLLAFFFGAICLWAAVRL